MIDNDDVQVNTSQEIPVVGNAHENRRVDNSIVAQSPTTLFASVLTRNSFELLENESQLVVIMQETNIGNKWVLLRPVVVNSKDFVQVLSHG